MKTEILQMHLAFKELTVLTIQSIMSSLHGWYGQLPEQMRLDAVDDRDMNVEVRRSIFHVHLLYLGAIILLYRRIASQFVRWLGVDRDRNLLGKPLEDLLRKHGEDAVVAASMSAKILGLLMEDHGIFKRCWLVM